MTKLGNWTTIDAPTEQIEKACNWLKEKFEVIGGSVRKVNNSHDFGIYPSFEIDMPRSLEFIDEPDCFCADCEDCIDWLKKEAWIEKANKIEEDYEKQFNKYL